MLRSCLLVGGALALASGATVDHARATAGRYNVAEERDGAHHAPASTGGSSYSAPAAQSHAAPASSYSAPSGGSTDQGNVYYYYYPTEEHGGHELAGNGFDVFTSIILPLVILGGLLLALSSLTFTFTGRSIGQEPGLVDQLETEVERLFNLYLAAMDSKPCKQRVFCQTGIYSKSQKYGDQFLSFVEAIIPETMKGNMNIFKAATKEGAKMEECMKFKCKMPKLFESKKN